MSRPEFDRETFISRDPIGHHWMLKLNRVKDRLEQNHFEAYVVESAAEAKRLVLEEIIPGTGAKSVGWGGSMTLEELDLRRAFIADEDLKTIDPWDEFAGSEDQNIHEVMRQNFHADMYFASANALTMNGQVVNVDMMGNRVGAIAFGPLHVVLIVGRNKIVKDMDAAMEHIKGYVSPAHMQRVIAIGMGNADWPNPCIKSGVCTNCKDVTRICNTWSIVEKSFPPKRIKVILVNEDLGV